MYRLIFSVVFLVSAVIPIKAMADIRLLIQFADGTQSVAQRISVSDRNPAVREAMRNSAGAIQFLEAQRRRSSPHALWFDREGNLLEQQPLRDPRLMHQPRFTMTNESENLSTSEAATIAVTNQGVILVTGPDEADSLEIHLPEIAHFAVPEETWKIVVPE